MAPRSRFPTTLVVTLAFFAVIVGGFAMFSRGAGTRYQAVQAVRERHSELHVVYTLEHVAGPIRRETWTLDDVDGRSSATYAALNRSGSETARFVQRITGYDVSFAFGKLVQDGIWELRTRYGRDTATIYTVTVAQVADGKRGTRTIRFSDPRYLANRAGREYHIVLRRDRPVPDLVGLQSSSRSDDRYAKIVADLDDFGSPAFKKTVAEARRRLLAAAS